MTAPTELLQSIVERTMAGFDDAQPLQRFAELRAAENNDLLHCPCPSGPTLGRPHVSKRVPNGSMPDGATPPKREYSDSSARSHAPERRDRCARTTLFLIFPLRSPRS